DVQCRKPQILWRGRTRRGDRSVSTRVPNSDIRQKPGLLRGLRPVSSRRDPDVRGPRLRGRPVQRHADGGDGKPDGFDRARLRSRAGGCGMTKSFELAVDGVIDALRAHVLPKSDDEFVRGQIFSIIFALNGLKLAADWKAGPLLEQVRLQDAAFAEVRRLADKLEHPHIPATPRAGTEAAGPAPLEALRDEGDRQL